MKFGEPYQLFIKGQGKLSRAGLSFALEQLALFSQSQKEEDYKK
jgi:hypothetical protein